MIAEINRGNVIVAVARRPVRLAVRQLKVLRPQLDNDFIFQGVGDRGIGREFGGPPVKDGFDAVETRPRFRRVGACDHQLAIELGYPLLI